MRIAHLTDTHIVGVGELMADRVDSRAALERAIDRIMDLDPLPDLVVATGDLVNDGRADQYDILGQVLARLSMRLVVCPGNHDDRTELRRRFGHMPEGEPHQPADHVVEVSTAGPTYRVIVLDTTTPGEHGGRLEHEQLVWLDEQLTAAAEHPTVLLQHHPPFLAGIPWMDDVALADIRAELTVLERHAHLVAVLSGHYHRSISVGIGNAVAWCAPSSAVQIDLTAPDPVYTSEPPGFAVHDIDADGRVRTHVVAVTDAERWRPAWSLAADE